MSKLIDWTFSATAYTQLSSTALAVVVRRVDGWTMYCGGVPGRNHDLEWPDILAYGSKLNEGVARALLAHSFYPPIDPTDLPYCL